MDNKNEVCKLAPLVSIIISAYNEENYIGEAVNSMLNQTYNNLEVIVVDDASTDNTVEILNAIEDDRLHVYVNSKNQKLAHNLNFAIQKSSGVYVARMDADDVSDMTRIEKQVEYMETHRDIDVLGSNAICFGNSEAALLYPQTHEEIKAALVFKNSMCHPSIMFRKKSLNELYDESYAASQDYELWSRLIWSHRFYNLSEQLLRYRVHNKQTRNTVGRKQKAGAMVARRTMLERLQCNISDEEYQLFDDMFLVGKKYDVNKIEEFDDFLYKLMLQNEKVMVFIPGFFNKQCEETFFENWYYAEGLTIRKLRCLKKSKVYKLRYSKLSQKYYKIIAHCVLDDLKKLFKKDL